MSDPGRDVRARGVPRRRSSAASRPCGRCRSRRAACGCSCRSACCSRRPRRSCNGSRGDLHAYAPLLTWGATGLQALLGLWLLALGFREAVPGRNVSARALTLAGALTALLVVAITVLDQRRERHGRRRRTRVAATGSSAWSGPTPLGAPFMVLADADGGSRVSDAAGDRRRPVRPVCGRAVGRGLAAELLDLRPGPHHRVAWTRHADPGRRGLAPRSPRRPVAVAKTAEEVTSDG